MTEQLQFVFNSGDWRVIIPHKLQRTYLHLEGLITRPELKAFYDAEEGELKETLRTIVLNKRTELLERCQEIGCWT